MSDKIVENPNPNNQDNQVRNAHQGSILQGKPEILDHYEPDHFPPNLNLAKKHGKAKRVAKSAASDNRDNNELEACECCGLPLENEQLPLCCPRSELYFLGPGFPLYFEFVIYCAIILGIMISVEGIYNIIANYLGNDCDDSNKCARNNINLISLSNKYTQHHKYIIQSWVNFGCAVAIVISMHLFRRVQRLTNLECDRGLLSPSDYSIMISHLHSQDCSEEEVKQVLYEFWKKIPKSDEENKKEIPIKKIVFSYNIGTYIELIRKKNKLILEQRRAIVYEKKHKCYPVNFDPEVNKEEIKKTTKLIDLEEQQVEKGAFKEKCGILFVSFNSESDRNKFFERCSFTPVQKAFLKIKSFFCKNTVDENLLTFKNKVLVVEKAPEPNDVLWENMHYTLKYKIKARSVIYSITIVILGICFALILGISYGQLKAKEVSGNSVNYGDYIGIIVLGVVSSFFIVFINTALTIILKKFGALEKHSTVTHLSISNAVKLSYAQFFNTAIIILVVKLIALTDDKRRIFSPGFNISSDLVSIFCTNAIFTPLLNLLNPWYFMRLAKRRQIQNEGENCLFTQAEANSAFEGGDVDMSVKYAALIKTVWLSAFYLTVTPIGAFISFFGTITVYFVDKYLILRRLSRPPLISNDLNEEMVEMLEFVPLAMGCGSLIFHHILFDPENYDQIADILTIGLSAINFFIPSVKINKFLFRFDEEVEEKTLYDDARIKFPIDYDRANPVTQEAAMIEWRNLIQKTSPNQQIQAKLDENSPPSPVMDGKNLNNFLKNYANANFVKLNNIIAQAPKNITQSQNLMPFFNLIQQGYTINPSPISLPNTFNQYISKVNENNSPDINRNQENFPLMNINHQNQTFGLPPPTSNPYPPYNNYPQVFQPPLVNPILPNYNPTIPIQQNIQPQPLIEGYNINFEQQPYRQEYNSNLQQQPIYNQNIQPPPVYVEGYNPNYQQSNYNEGYNPQNQYNTNNNYNTDNSGISNRPHEIPQESFIPPYINPTNYGGQYYENR